MIWLKSHHLITLANSVIRAEATNTDTHCSKESSQEEMWEITNESERCKYLSVENEWHELLHHPTKVAVVNKRRLYQLTFITQKKKRSIKELRESVINSDNFSCPSRYSNTNHRCMYKRGRETIMGFKIASKHFQRTSKHFWGKMKHDICTTESSKYQ